MIKWFGRFVLMGVALLFAATLHAQTMGLAPSGGGSPAYVVDAVDFDGTNDFLTRGADLTGNGDGQQATVSVWFRLDGGDGSGLLLYSQDGATENVLTRKSGNNRLRTIFRDTGGTIEQEFQTTPSFTASATWHHVIFAFDLSVPVCKIFVDDAAITLSVNTCNSDTINFTQPDHIIGALTTGGSSKFNGCLSELYVNLSAYVDIGVTAERRKFVTVNNKPVDPGSDGSIPTGTSPIIYLNGDSTDFETNQGTGGNFSVTGALTACSTSPSD